MPPLGLALALAACTVASAGQPTPEEASRALAQVHSAIARVEDIGAICRDAFPDLAVASALALDDWRGRRAAFLDEVARRRAREAEVLSRGDPAVLARILAERAADRARERAALRAALAGDSETYFHGQCAMIPMFVHADRNDVENALASAVAIMRRTPLHP